MQPVQFEYLGSTEFVDILPIKESDKTLYKVTSNKGINFTMKFYSRDKTMKSIWIQHVLPGDVAQPEELVQKIGEAIESTY